MQFDSYFVRNFTQAGYAFIKYQGLCLLEAALGFLFVTALKLTYCPAVFIILLNIIY